MSKPTVTAEYETGPPRPRLAWTQDPPSALITVTYHHGDHQAALDELRMAYEEVREQIIVTGPHADWPADKAHTCEDVKIPGPGPEGLAGA